MRQLVVSLLLMDHVIQSIFLKNCAGPVVGECCGRHPRVSIPGAMISVTVLENTIREQVVILLEATIVFEEIVSGHGSASLLSLVHAKSLTLVKF